MWDSDLTDASINSDHDVTDCVEYIARFLVDNHGSVLSSRSFDQLNFHVPSIKIESDGSELLAVQQLLGGLYSESQQLQSTIDPSVILIASELIEAEHDGEVLTVRICLKSLSLRKCDATTKATMLSSLYCALHGVPGDIEWFPTGVIAAWNGCLSTHLNGERQRRHDFCQGWQTLKSANEPNQACLALRSACNITWCVKTQLPHTPTPTNRPL